MRTVILCRLYDKINIEFLLVSYISNVFYKTYLLIYN
jgi:hypothetical protein